MKKGLLILFNFFLFSCSVPTIVILEDPLTSQEHVNLGYIYEKQGKLELAEKEYKKAIKKRQEKLDSLLQSWKSICKERRLEKS